MCSAGSLPTVQERITAALVEAWGPAPKVSRHSRALARRQAATRRRQRTAAGLPVNDPTGPARRVYEWLYGESLPAGWRVEWVRRLPGGTTGYVLPRERRLQLSVSAARTVGAVWTLAALFVMMRSPNARGAERAQMIAAARARLGLEVR